MKYLITGGCGFLGSNLAYEVLKRREELLIFDNLSRFGSELNLKWLKSQGDFQFIKENTQCQEALESTVQAFQPDVIFHLAGQVAMSTSIQNPRLDFETNVVGGLNLIEAVRKYSAHSVIIYSSTNKVYGDLEQMNYVEQPLRYSVPEYPNGFNESLPLNFQSPYGCSKGAMDQYLLDYARVFGLKAIVFRHSSIFGGRQYATYDQGWIGWFIQKALETKRNKNAEPFTISGNGKQVRDVLFSSDLVNCYFRAIDTIKKNAKISGQAFNIGGGMSNSLSLLELFQTLEEALDIKLRYRILPVRQSDQKVFVADIKKAWDLFQWKPEVDKNTALKEAIVWNQETYAV